MRPLLLLLAISSVPFLCGGCSGEGEDIDVRVEVTSDAVTFAWPGGNVHHLIVDKCGPDGCPACGMRGAESAWRIFTPGDDGAEARGATIPTPIAFGATPEGHEDDAFMKPLVPGERYQVFVRRWRDRTEDVWDQGCAPFTR